MSKHRIYPLSFFRSIHLSRIFLRIVKQDLYLEWNYNKFSTGGKRAGEMDGWMMKGKKNRRDVDIYICLFRYIYTNNLALPSSCSNRWSNFNRFATTLGRIVRNVIRVYRPFVGFPLRICLSAKFRRGTSGLDGVAHSDAIQLLRNPWSATS